MPNYLCVVNEAGPGNSGPTSNPNVAVNLTDTGGSFASTWFYAAEGIQDQLLDACIAAIIGNKRMEVTAVAPNPTGVPYTEISRIAESRPLPPAAPTGLQVVQLGPAGQEGRSTIVFAWTDNSGGEAGFNLTYAGKLEEHTSDTQGVGNLKAVTFSFDVINSYTYTASVTAVNAGGESAADTIGGTIPGQPPLPSAPIGLRVTDILSKAGFGASSINIEWTDTSDIEKTFHVTYAGTPNPPPTVSPYSGDLYFPADTTSATLSANGGLIYTINVTAVGEFGTSAPATINDVVVPYTPPPTQTVTVTMKEQQVIEGPIPYLGKYPLLSDSSLGYLEQITIPSSIEVLALNFIKPGHSSAEGYDPDAVVTVTQGTSTTPEQMAAIFGKAEPVYSLAQPISFLACLVLASAGPNISSVNITITILSLS